MCSKWALGRTRQARPLRSTHLHPAASSPNSDANRFLALFFSLCVGINIKKRGPIWQGSACTRPIGLSVPCQSAIPSAIELGAPAPRQPSGACRDWRRGRGRVRPKERTAKDHARSMTASPLLATHCACVDCYGARDEASSGAHGPRPCSVASSRPGQLVATGRRRRVRRRQSRHRLTRKRHPRSHGVSLHGL